MKLFIYNILKTIYEGSAESVTLPTTSGEITILPKHIPLVSSLKSGLLKYSTNSKPSSIDISSGFVYTDGKKVIVLLS